MSKPESKDAAVYDEQFGYGTVKVWDTHAKVSLTLYVTFVTSIYNHQVHSWLLLPSTVDLTLLL
jgi:hypothetical protein